MMGAAKATYYQTWEAKMNELKAINGKAWEWLMGVPTKMWCKHTCVPNALSLDIMQGHAKAKNKTQIVSRER
jgi:hypothetical protein